MTKPLTREVKKQRAVDRKIKAEVAQKEKRKELTSLIKIYGTPYRVAKKLRISPSAFYEQMDRVGLKREVNHLLKGEPTNKREKKQWFRKMLKTNTIPQLAKRLKRSKTAIRERLKKLDIKTSQRNK